MNITLNGMINLGHFTAGATMMTFNEERVEEFTRDMVAAAATEHLRGHNWALDKVFYEMFVSGEEAFQMGTHLEELIAIENTKGGFTGDAAGVTVWMSDRGVRPELIAAFCNIIRANAAEVGGVK